MKVFFFFIILLLLTFLLHSNFEDVHAIIYEAPHRHTNLEAMHCGLESINNCKKKFLKKFKCWCEIISPTKTLLPSIVLNFVLEFIINPKFLFFASLAHCRLHSWCCGLQSSQISDVIKASHSWIFHLPTTCKYVIMLLLPPNVYENILYFEKIV